MITTIYVELFLVVLFILFIAFLIDKRFTKVEERIQKLEARKMELLYEEVEA